jgi:hypothetical protein
MGNMQFNLDQTFENVSVKDSSNPADIIAEIKKVEDKVSVLEASLNSNFTCCLSDIVLIGSRRNVRKHLGPTFEAHQKRSASDRTKVRLDQTTRDYQMMLVGTKR